MEDFLTSLSNREIALLIWAGIFIIVLVSIKGTRDSIKGIIKAFIQKQILIVFFALATYSVIIIYIFYKLNIWDSSLNKDSIFWFIGSALILFFNINEAKNINYFKSIIKDSIKLTIVIEFIVNFYVFNLWAELAILPFLVFIAMMQAYAETDKKYKSVESILKSVLSYFGIALLVFILYKTVTEFGSLFSINNLKSILLPPIFTILLLPFIYIVALYSNYETLFIRIDFMSNDIALKKALKRNIFLIANLSLSKLNSISNKLYKSDIYHNKDLFNYLKSISK